MPLFFFLFLPLKYLHKSRCKTKLEKTLSGWRMLIDPLFYRIDFLSNGAELILRQKQREIVHKTSDLGRV